MIISKPLRELLEAYDASSELERLYKRAMLDFLAQHKDAFERSQTVGHFTASAWLLSRDAQKALLMHHKKLDRWFQLGGHADGDPALLAVAIKEAQEESGIHDIRPVSSEIFDLDIHGIPANAKDARHFHFDVRFLLQVHSEENFQANSESKELRWIGKNPIELPTNNASVARMFEKWRRGWKASP